MSLSVDALVAMSTLELIKLRDNYTLQKINLPRQRYRHIASTVTDRRRCDDAISLINRVIKSRQRRNQPLREFAD